MVWHLDPPEIIEARQKELLALARTTIAAYLQNGGIPIYETEDLGLTQALGAFVTLRDQEDMRPADVQRTATPLVKPMLSKGKLRGCIGCVWADRPLWQVVQQMAVAAATSDPRLPPLTAAEIGQVNIEISVLSPLFRVQDVRQIQIGVHGLMLVHDQRRGVLLPQVPLERGWNPQVFLDHLCLKAGISPDFLDETSTVYGFTTVSFAEEQ